jgi:SAM-dependent methyltransferase
MGYNLPKESMKKGHLLIHTSDMIGTGTIDPGKEIDWGKTSRDYARYRPGPPMSLFDKLQALGVGNKGQSVLDLGTGTGVLARQFKKQGCDVTGTDISEEQIKMAQTLALGDSLEIDFRVASAEESDFPDNSFDVISANQCFLYFDKSIVFPKIKKMLRPGGVLVISHFSWMPFLDPIAKASEELILKHNPSWSAHSYKGEIPPEIPSFKDDFNVSGFFYYDEDIPFTRESWRGRIRACRGVGAAMTAKEVESFDTEHGELLGRITDQDSFTIVHRLDAHIFRAIS